MKIYFVSSNPGKIREVKQILSKFGIKVETKRVELPEIKSESQEEISKEKARVASGLLNAPVIVDDTGIYFEAYTNFPGTNPKFVFFGIGYKGIFKLLKGESRKAYFKTTVAYCEPGKEPVTFVGLCKGRIAEEVRGEIDEELPYDNIFIPEGETRTFAEMSKEEKAKYSHRARALEKFARWFLGRFKL